MSLLRRVQRETKKKPPIEFVLHTEASPHTCPLNTENGFYTLRASAGPHLLNFAVLDTSHKPNECEARACGASELNTQFGPKVSHLSTQLQSQRKTSKSQEASVKRNIADGKTCPLFSCPCLAYVKVAGRRRQGAPPPNRFVSDLATICQPIKSPGICFKHFSPIAPSQSLRTTSPIFDNRRLRWPPAAVAWQGFPLTFTWNQESPPKGNSSKTGSSVCSHC